ncbi:hypothetical protein Tco_1561909 [Tanacetum coccineum]
MLNLLSSFKSKSSLSIPGGIVSSGQENISTSSLRESLSSTGIGIVGKRLDDSIRIVLKRFLGGRGEEVLLGLAKISMLILEEVDGMTGGAGVEIGQNHNRENFDSLFVGKPSISFDCSTGPDCKQTELEVDNRNHNEHRSHRSHNKDIVVADSENNVELRQFPPLNGPPQHEQPGWLYEDMSKN